MVLYNGRAQHSDYLGDPDCFGSPLFSLQRPRQNLQLPWRARPGRGSRFQPDHCGGAGLCRTFRRDCHVSRDRDRYCRPALRIRPGWILRGYRASLAAVLETRRLLGLRQRQGQDPFLGFFEEPRSGRRLPAYHLRHRRFLSEALYCPPNLVFRSLSHCPARGPTMSADDKPAVSYWHLWTDEQGISHQTRCELTEFEKDAIQPGAAPQWIGSKTKSDATVFITVLPPRWVGDWHENPKPQWIVPLSGPVGNEPAILMLIQFETPPEGPSPCRFR